MKHAIDTPKQLGEIIRLIRKAQGVRQDDLAGIVGASHVFLRDLERGKPTVQFGKTLDVLRELGIRLVADVPDALTPAKPTAASARYDRKRRVQSDD
jgi:transcriptional regulator with XRE-family HTH domain